MNLKIIFLGEDPDYVDRGLQSAELMNIIKNVHEEAGAVEHTLSVRR